jgi:hypothetical protein
LQQDVAHLPSKHNLLRAFQIAQQIAAIPIAWNFFPKGSHFSTQIQHRSNVLAHNSLKVETNVKASLDLFHNTGQLQDIPHYHHQK